MQLVSIVQDLDFVKLEFNCFKKMPTFMRVLRSSDVFESFSRSLSVMFVKCRFFSTRPVLWPSGIFVITFPVLSKFDTKLLLAFWLDWPGFRNKSWKRSWLTISQIFDNSMVKALQKQLENRCDWHCSNALADVCFRPPKIEKRCIFRRQEVHYHCFQGSFFWGCPLKMSNR